MYGVNEVDPDATLLWERQREVAWRRQPGDGLPSLLRVRGNSVLLRSSVLVALAGRAELHSGVPPLQPVFQIASTWPGTRQYPRSARGLHHLRKRGPDSSSGWRVVPGLFGFQSQALPYLILGVARGGGTFPGHSVTISDSVLFATGVHSGALARAVNDTHAGLATAMTAALFSPTSC